MKPQNLYVNKSSLTFELHMISTSNSANCEIKEGTDSEEEQNATSFATPMNYESNMGSH